MFFDKYREKRDGAIRYYDIRNKGVKVLCLIILFICILIVLVSLFPPVWVFLASLKNIREFMRNPTILPEHYDLSVFAESWNKLKFLKYYVNSFIVVFGSIICAVVFNGLLAYALAILKPKGHKIITGLVMWSLLIPPTTSVVALFVNINKIGLSGSFLPLWLAFGANSFYVLLFKNFFEKLPIELIEAAKLDGCDVFQVFFRIILPLSKSIVLVIVIFAMTAAWSDFLLPFLVLKGSGYETVMVRLFQFKDSSTNSIDVLRAVVFSIIPPTVLFLLFQRQITDGAANGAIKG
ncbi:MAG: carbohydrate ABC transporter permease [Flexilinea sp.]